MIKYTISKAVPCVDTVEVLAESEDHLWDKVYSEDLAWKRTCPDIEEPLIQIEKEELVN